MAAMAMTGEHPQDVLERIAFWQSQKRACALVVITNTVGGAVRAPGALLAVCEQDHFGYISGGCIDADVVLQARQAIADHKNRKLRYGAGSPFVDLPLPCGGAIDVQIIPNPNKALILELSTKLASRQPVTLMLDRDGTFLSGERAPAGTDQTYAFQYTPKLRLRIAGRGADALALAKIADAAGYEVLLQLLDEDDIADAGRAGLKRVERLSSAAGLPAVNDDAWTAFVLLFHDRDWETPLLLQALAGPAFYIGAVGSRQTHAKRCEALRLKNCAAADIARIHGPIGLIPSLRDASAIALSTLAEIVQVASIRARTPTARTALVLLAAGASSRFEDGDKLLATYRGRSVLDHSAKLRAAAPAARAIAVIAPNDTKRSSILRNAGWEIIENDAAHSGQASSLKRALERLASEPHIDQIVIFLGDMPNVTEDHLRNMMTLAQDTSISAIMSEAGQVLCPPALFKRKHFATLTGISGDRGAKSVFLDIENGAQTLQLSPDQAIDIDRIADLADVSETEIA